MRHIRICESFARLKIFEREAFEKLATTTYNPPLNKKHSLISP